VARLLLTSKSRFLAEAFERKHDARTYGARAG
jgi:hypothetical protein